MLDLHVLPAHPFPISLMKPMHVKANLESLVKTNPGSLKETTWMCYTLLEIPTQNDANLFSGPITLDS